MSTDTAENLATTSPDAAAQARDQADAYESIFGTTDLKLDNGTTLKIPPHPDFGMLDDEATAEYEALKFKAESYDREEDVTYDEYAYLDADTGNPTGLIIPKRTIRGQLKTPYRETTEVDGHPVTTLVTPPHRVSTVMAALGADGYKKLRDGGKSSADVWAIWGKQAMAAQEREAQDSKSVGSTVGVAAVSTADSE